ncbi:hypothetical protein A3F66_00655 [candidate division TM6 bacterium RIFCSPHIGHO2_12_FULL_32_22]|nr:MAG: hypothetical protein A3F66_00655 [candidate division TM6 bacterium RIFCSPHIGHO2_12_FULL_32_22]
MNISNLGVKRLDRAIAVLKYSFGLFFLAAGLDKFFFLIVDWRQYVSPLLVDIVPTSLTYFLYGVGVLEILIGLYIIFRCACSGGWIAAIYLLIISINLLSFGFFFDIAVRDLMLALSAYAMSAIVYAREEIS